MARLTPEADRPVHVYGAGDPRMSTVGEPVRFRVRSTHPVARRSRPNGTAWRSTSAACGDLLVLDGPDVNMDGARGGRAGYRTWPRWQGFR